MAGRGEESEFATSNVHGEALGLLDLGLLQGEGDPEGHHQKIPPSQRLEIKSVQIAGRAILGLEVGGTAHVIEMPVGAKNVTRLQTQMLEAHLDDLDICARVYQKAGAGFPGGTDIRIGGKKPIGNPPDAMTDLAYGIQGLHLVHSSQIEGLGSDVGASTRGEKVDYV